MRGLMDFLNKNHLRSDKHVQITVRTLHLTNGEILMHLLNAYVIVAHL